ncbi:MAG: hypothetical protein ACLFQV_05235 [Vulcanimicrobiota bacterium]
MSEKKPGFSKSRFKMAESQLERIEAQAYSPGSPAVVPAQSSQPGGESLFQPLLSSIPFGLIFTDKQNRIQWLNSEAAGLIGAGENGSLVGKALDNVLDEFVITQNGDVFSFIGGNSAQLFEYTARIKNRQINFKVTPVYENDIFIGVLRVLCEVEPENENLEEILLIKGLGKNLVDLRDKVLKKYEPGGNIGESFADILNNLESLFYTVNKKNNLVPLNINKLIERLKPVLKSLLPGFIIKFKLAPGLKKILVAEQQIETVLEQIFLSLENMSGGGGEIVLSTSNKNTENNENNNSVMIKIKANANKAQAGDKQLSFKETGNEKGTGLGLFLVYNIIRRLKGSIKVRKEDSHKICFEIILPALNKFYL